MCAITETSEMTSASTKVSQSDTWTSWCAYSVVILTQTYQPQFALSFPLLLHNGQNMDWTFPGEHQTILQNRYLSFRTNYLKSNSGKSWIIYAHVLLLVLLFQWGGICIPPGVCHRGFDVTLLVSPSTSVTLLVRLYYSVLWLRAAGSASVSKQHDTG